MVKRVASTSLGALAVIAASLGGPIQGASANDHSRAHVVTRSTSAVSAAGSRVERVPVDSSRRDAAQIVIRPIAEPAAVVSRELSQQPVQPHLVEVKVGVTSIMVDPEVHYGRLDENHTIRRAQRLAEVRRPTLPAQVIRNPRLASPTDASVSESGPHQMPQMIFLRPDLLERMEKNTQPSLPDVQDREGSPKPPIPHVPAPPREKPERLVHAG